MAGQLRRWSLETQGRTRRVVDADTQLLVDPGDSFCTGRSNGRQPWSSSLRCFVQQHSVCIHLAELLSECGSSKISLDHQTDWMKSSNRIPVLFGNKFRSQTTATAASGQGRLQLEFGIETSGDPASVNDSEIRVPEPIRTMQE